MTYRWASHPHRRISLLEHYSISTAVNGGWSNQDVGSGQDGEIGPNRESVTMAPIRLAKGTRARTFVRQLFVSRPIVMQSSAAVDLNASRWGSVFAKMVGDVVLTMEAHVICCDQIRPRWENKCLSSCEWKEEEEWRSQIIKKTVFKDRRLGGRLSSLYYTLRWLKASHLQEGHMTSSLL